jgi:drug/metabolite transporter (DMT)-like permease
MEGIFPMANDTWIQRSAVYLVLTVPPLCWGANAVLAKGVVDLIPPVSFAFFRWTLAFLIIAPFAAKKAKKDWPLVAGSWKVVLFLSVCGISSFNTLLYTAVHTTTAINCALIQTTMPAVIILISLVVFKDRISKLQGVGVCLCIAGAFLVVLRGSLLNLLQLNFLQGDLLMVVAVFLYALYSAFLRKRPAIHPLSFLFYTFGTGSFLLIPLYLWELTHRQAPVMSASVAGSVLFVAVFPSIVAYFCWNRGIESIGANRAGLFINLTPVFASIMAVIWLDEPVLLFQIVGMALIVTGMVIFNRQ